ncbi:MULTISPECIES: DUF7210 family protein [Paenibacillus]|uniref:DUF7210 family protein n=1 Tax=Paenibacillus TaxID=44249 RepID=UPI0004ADD693|nr:hypothetical protein [Paenibacillus sp. IHBB 10380]
MGYVAKGKVLHNGKYYQPGEEVNGLKKEEADRLLKLDVIEEEKKAGKSKEDSKPEA